MSTSDTTYWLVQRLRRLIESHGFSAHSLSVALCQKGLRNKLAESRLRSLKLDDVITILEFLGEPLDSLLTDSTVAREPIRLLRKHRLALAPRSPDLRRWLRQEYSLPGIDPHYRIPAEVAEIRSLRMAAPSQALHYAQRWVDDVLTRLSQRPSAKDVLDLSNALTSWASAALVLGQPSDAAFAVEHAAACWSEEQSPQGDSWTRLLYQTGFIVKDLSGLEGAKDALPLLQQSLGLAHLAGDRELILSQYLGLVSLARDAEQYDLALSSARSALQYAEQPADFLTLYQYLAVISCELGQHEQAQEYLDSTATLDTKLATWPRSQLIWTQARIYAGLGRLRAAAQLLDELLSVQPHDPVDHLLIFCDLAKVLHQLGEPTRLKQRAITAAQLISRLEATPATVRLVDQFLQQCQQGSVSQRKIEATVRSLNSSRR